MREITLRGRLGGLTRHGGAPGPRPSDSQAAPTPAASQAHAAPGRPGGGDEGVPVVVLRDAPEASGPETDAPEADTASLVAEAAELLSDRDETTSQGRDILVKYDRTFLGVYHAPRKITNRTAYQTIAAFIRSEHRDFDPEKLVLYRPAMLTPPPPQEILAGKRVGRFTRFDRPGGSEAVG